MYFKRFNLLFVVLLSFLSAGGNCCLAQGITDKTVMFYDACAPGKTPEIKDDRNGRIHAVGIYHGHVPDEDGEHRYSRPRHDNPVGDVDIVVSPKPKPIVLLLCSYDPVRWNVQLQPGAKVEKIILSGYHQQEIIGSSRSIPVLMTSYKGAAAWGPNVQIGGFDYFWVNERYDPGKDERHHHFEVTNWVKLFSLVQKLYGKPEIATFQGAREGIRFFI